MNSIALTLGSAAVLLLSSPVFADLQVAFIEGAPKDRFIIRNTSNCDLGPADLVIDFAGSDAGLIFDVTGAGAGVEVFQPFEVTAGAQYLATQPVISDGDQRATLNMTGLGTKETIAFTIDVDDTNGTRAITVADSEMSGTTVSLIARDNAYSAVMATSATVVLDVAACDE